jgi:thiol:disulfide interchange protein DsbA
MNRRSSLVSLVTLPVVLLGLPLRAATGELREGVDYARVPTPQPPSRPGIEVVEFFSYGCPHCNEFAPTVAKWRTTLPKDVFFRRVPISFGNPKWVALAKLYLTIEATGDLARIDAEVFSAIHEKKLPLVNDKAVIDWAVKRVADPKRFTDMYQSMGLDLQVKRAEQMGLAFGITGVPSFAVAGRYLVVAKEATSRQDVLRVADRVIELARRAAPR